jgi:hypothetical protein
MSIFLGTREIRIQCVTDDHDFTTLAEVCFTVYIYLLRLTYVMWCHIYHPLILDPSRGSPLYP